MANQRIQFSLADVFRATIFIALGLAALRNATPLLAAGACILTIALIVVGIADPLFRGDKTRLSAGIAVCGTTILYLAALVVLRDALPTSRLLAYLDSRVNLPHGTRTALLQNAYGRITQQESFTIVGHCLVILLLAFFVRRAARRLFARRQKRGPGLPH
jgi:hypothetical protein